MRINLCLLDTENQTKTNKYLFVILDTNTLKVLYMTYEITWDIVTLYIKGEKGVKNYIDSNETQK